MNDERGFALPDALIAAAIGAMVAVSAAQGLGVAARSARSAEALDRVVSEGEIIAARLRAKVSEGDVLSGFTGWRIERAPYVADGEQDRNEGPGFLLVTAIHDAEPPFRLQLVLIDHGPAQ